MKKNKRKTSNNSRSFQTITLCFSTSLVLILIGLVVLTVLSARNLSDNLKENLSVTLYLEKDLNDAQGQTFANELRGKKYTSEVSFISKDEIIKMQEDDLGADPTDFVGSNPFSSEIELYLSAEYANTDSVTWIQDQLKKDKRVSDLQYQENLIDQVNNTVNKISLALIILAAVLTVISFSLINNTVRLGVYARRFAIRTMKLVGASWSFIRWPFLRNALFVGFLSAIIACLCLGTGIYLIFNAEPDAYKIITYEVMAITGIAVFVFGMIITFFCAYFSVNKFLKMTAGDLYKI